ncbi:MAG: hypothetical protein SFU99_20405 [Saprospiraceae bacterium]|nr:hypothetical protein [Saprospiraceae bacterium]
MSENKSIGKMAAGVVSGVIIVAATLYTIQPNTGIYHPDNEASKMIAFKRTEHEQARIGYEVGECGIENFDQILKQLKQEDLENYFFPIPKKGTRRYNEYINLMYIKQFDKIVCADGEFYVARFDIGRASCDYTQSLKECGSDLLRKDTYKNMVYWLVRNGLGEEHHWRPKREIKNKSCECPLGQ